MRKLGPEEIRQGAAEFAAELKARPLEIPIRNGRVNYKRIILEPRLVQARVKDGQNREWTATGPTCRAAFQAVLTQLERAAGAGDETARTLLGLIESAPNRRPPHRGPGQGSLL